MADRVTITGKIVSGLRQGAFFTMLDWVQDQCLSQLGFEPYPGTLNIAVSGQSLPAARALLKMDGKQLVPPDSAFCSGKVFPVTIEGLSAAAVIPATAVRSHSGDIVELIAAINLREALSLSDGDAVTVVISTPRLKDGKSG